LCSLPILDMLPCSGDIRDQSLKWYKIDQNFAYFGPQIFLGGELPEFLDLHYKIQPASHHLVKFHGDRPWELGDLELNKENIWGKT